MGSTDQIDVIRLIELRHDIIAEQISSAAWTDAPALRLFRIGPRREINEDEGFFSSSRDSPEQITHRSIVRHFHLSIDLSDLIESVDRRTQSSVHAKDLTIDHCG